MSKPAVKHRECETRSTASLVADLDSFSNSLSSFEFRPAAKAVEALRETHTPLVSHIECPVCRERELRRLRREKSRLSKLLLQPGVLAAILFDFPAPSDYGAAQ